MPRANIASGNESLIRMYRTVFRIHDCFAADLDGGSMFGELGDHDLAFVQFLGMVEPSVLSAGQADHLHPVILRLDHKIFIKNWVPSQGRASFLPEHKIMAY